MIKKARRAIDYRRFVRSLVTPCPDEVIFGFGRGTDAWNTLNHLWICGRCGDAEYDIDTDSELATKHGSSRNGMMG